MFGSPSASTPFGKFRPSIVPSASMSFGQQSAAKRKRDQMSGSSNEPQSTRAVKLIRREPAIPSSGDGETTSCVLNSFGQLLLCRDSSQTRFHPNVVEGTEAGFVALAGHFRFSDETECGMGPSESSDIVSCGHDGTVVMLNVTVDGNQIALTHKLPVKAEDEHITAICHAGNVVVLGTSAEALYLVRRYGRTLNADPLQRNRSLFANLLSSGARFMGIAPVVDADARIVKVIPVPMSYFLLSLSNSTLSLWADWTNPGSEEVVWDQNIRDLLRADTAGSQTRHDTKLEIVDACLMQVEPGAERASLLVLSACYADRHGTGPAALWLHTLEVQLPASGTVASGRSPVSILHHSLVAEEAQYQPFATSREVPAPKGYFAPRIASLPPSWRVFVAWSAVGAAATAEMQASSQRGLFPSTSTEPSDATASGAVRTLHAVQIDVLNQPLIGASRAAEGCDNLRTHAVDSGLSAVTVLAASAVKGVDGLCVVLADGQIVSFCPPLPSRASMAFPLQAAVVRDRQLPTGPSTSRAADAASLLTKAALGELVQQDTSKAVLDSLSACNSAEVLQAVTAASAKLLSRAPAGEYWGAGTGAGEQAGALTRYQMVHRLVESKLNAHKQLIDLVSSSGAFGQEAVQRVLWRDHQQVLLCAGLSGAVEESQLRLFSGSADALSGASEQSPAQLATQEALRVVALGMERAVTAGRKQSVESIEAQGLSVADVFYTETSNIYGEIGFIEECLRESQQRLAGKNVQMAANFHVASLLLSALQLAAVGDGADVTSTSSACIHEVRRVVASVVALLRDSSASLDSARGVARSSDWTAVLAVDRDGKRIKELCAAALQSYSVEAGRAGCAVEDMPEPWKAAYHDLKKLCSELLLSTGHAQAAFALCCEHLYCDGLMTSAQREPQVLRVRLEDALRRHGEQRGTDTVPLATACFLWLEARSQPDEILRLGLTNAPLLGAFLQTRPSLAWMHHLRSGNFHAAAVTASETATGVHQVVKAKTLLSIAKLSSKLAADSDAAPAQKGLFAEAKASNQSPAEHSAFEASMKSLNADLAVLKAQEVLLETLPNIDLSADARANVSDLVKIITGALRYHGGSTSTGPIASAEHPLYVPDASALVRCFGMGLGLLSMQMDLVDGLIAESTSANAARESASLAGQFASSSAQSKLAELKDQQARLAAMQVELWAALIAANTSAWLELACSQSIGAVEEGAVRTDCWLFEGVVNALEDLQTGGLRQEMVALNVPVAHGAAGTSTTLLGRAVAASGVAAMRLDADGECRNLPAGDTNSRAVHIIKVCVSMALNDGPQAMQ